MPFPHFPSSPNLTVQCPTIGKPQINQSLKTKMGYALGLTGRDWGQEEKGMTVDEMAGWHHWLDGRESEWTPGVGDGQGGLTCCDSWGRKESDTTEQLNWIELSLTRFMSRASPRPWGWFERLTLADWISYDSGLHIQSSKAVCIVFL